jgi:hypothetical protein
MKYTLTLYLADIKINIFLDQHQDYIFLKYKYQKYTAPSSTPTIRNSKNTVVQAQYSIKLGRQSRQKYQKRGQTYYFLVLPIRKNFWLFNELLRSVFIIELAHQGGFLLHASSLIKSGKAWLFIGHPGAGKSTMRRLYPEKLCLGDDLAIIRQIGSSRYLYGSPFYARTQTSYPNQRFPLGPIFTVKLSSHYLLEKLSFPQNAQVLIEQCFLPGVRHEPKLKEKIISLVWHTSQVSPIYRLVYKKSRQVISFIVASNKLLQQPNPESSPAVLEKINPIARAGLPPKISWQLFTGSVEYLKTCQVIDALSWKFEFSSAKTVKQIAQQVFDQKILSGHSHLIRKKAAQPLAKHIPIVLLNNIIVDGNHRAIAAYHQYIQKKQLAQPLLFYRGIPLENHHLPS